MGPLHDELFKPAAELIMRKLKREAGLRGDWTLRQEPRLGPVGEQSSYRRKPDYCLTRGTPAQVKNSPDFRLVWDLKTTNAVLGCSPRRWFGSSKCGESSRQRFREKYTPTQYGGIVMGYKKKGGGPPVVTGWWGARLRV
jgi:hypothetical protein